MFSNVDQSRQTSTLARTSIFSEYSHIFEDIHKKNKSSHWNEIWRPRSPFPWFSSLGLVFDRLWGTVPLFLLCGFHAQTHYPTCSGNILEQLFIKRGMSPKGFLQHCSAYALRSIWSTTSGSSLTLNFSLNFYNR